MKNKIKNIFNKTKSQYQRSLEIFWRNVNGVPSTRRTKINDDIYLGGQYSFKGISMLKKLGISAIVNMRMKPIAYQEHMEGFKLLHLPTPDRKPPTINQLKQGAEFIKNEINNGGKVYIHCRAGEGRGPSMAIAYLISTGIKFDEAYKFVKAKRTFIRPNKKQVARLRQFETEIYN